MHANPNLTLTLAVTVTPTLTLTLTLTKAALVHALRERRIAGAALDVFGEGSAPPPGPPAHYY